MQQIYIETRQMQNNCKVTLLLKEKKKHQRKTKQNKIKCISSSPAFEAELNEQEAREIIEEAKQKSREKKAEILAKVKPKTYRTKTKLEEQKEVISKLSASEQGKFTLRLK